MEQEERLLSLVEVYGRNWKFIADYFLEARAPLALKNRYSLLMRRLKRKGTGQQQLPTIDASVLEHARSSPTDISGASACQLPTGLLDLTGLFDTSSRGPHGNPLDYPAGINASASDFCPSTTPFRRTTTTITPPPTAVTSPGTAWDDQGFWQNHHYLGEGMELDGTSSNRRINGEANEREKTASVPETHSNSGPEPPRDPSQNFNLGSRGSRERTLHNVGREDHGTGGTAAAAVDYTVTCKRGKLRTLTNHLVEAAMEESVGWVAEEGLVTLTLQLRV